MDTGRKNLLGAPLKAWTIQPLIIKRPGDLAITDNVTEWTEFAEIMIDEMILHSTSIPEVLEEISYENRDAGNKDIYINDTL